MTHFSLLHEFIFYSSLMAAITCFVGLHYGHILVHCKVICIFLLLAEALELLYHIF